MESENPEFQYEDGVFYFYNGNVEVTMSEDTFNEYMRAYLISQGMETRTEVELLDYASEVGRQQVTVEKMMRNPLYWLDIGRYTYTSKKERGGIGLFMPI